jgi:PAS domain S-box-containing protein
VRAAAAPIRDPDGTILGAVAVLTDMTRLQAEAAEWERVLADLSGERALLRTVLEQMPVAVFIVEAPSGRVLAMNDAVARIWGEPRPHSEAASQYSEEWVGYHPDGRRVASEEWPVARAALAGETVTDWVGEIERPDGTRVTIEASAAPVHDATGRTIAAVAVVADITARAQAARERERLLRALEVERARLAYVFRQAPAFLAVLRGPTHVFELVNAAYTDLIGGRAVVGQPFVDALPEVRDQGFVERLDHVLATGEPFLGREVPVMLARTLGGPLERRYVDYSYLPVVEADGTRSGVIAHGSDVTEQVEARHEIERLLSESERARAEAEAARQRTALLQVLTAALSTASTVDEVARAVVTHATAVLGATGTVIARLTADGAQLELMRAGAMPDALFDEWRCFPVTAPVPLAEVARTGEPLFLGSRADADARFPQLRPMLEAAGQHANAVLPLIVEGRVLGVIGAAFDAERTFDQDDRLVALAVAHQCAQALERARLYEAEHAARAEAEAAWAAAAAASRAKGEFLAVMSHELRTPLNAIGGYAELMEMGIRGPVTDQQREDLGRIQRSQRHLLGLVNEVLDYAKLESGSVRYVLADVAVREALTDAAGLVAPQARAKGLALSVTECPTDADGWPLAVRADPEKLRQVLVNLLSNAVKFTDPGGHVTVTCAEHDARVEIQVRDTGIGIPADKLEAIFEPFVQVRADLTRAAEGTGLGLAISRDLARGMGGDLTATGELGSGSTFTLTLPLGSVPAA